MTVEEKAERLLLERRVTIPACSAIVRGDHDVYAVRREGDRWRCPCKARVECSHILAVKRVTGG